MNKKIIFFTKELLEGLVIATRPETGSTIIFKDKESKWDISPRDYYQLIADTNFYEITEEEAQAVYKEILPDEKLLDKIDSLRKPTQA